MSNRTMVVSNQHKNRQPYPTADFWLTQYGLQLEPFDECNLQKQWAHCDIHSEPRPTGGIHDYLPWPVQTGAGPHALGREQRSRLRAPHQRRAGVPRDPLRAQESVGTATE